MYARKRLFVCIAAVSGRSKERPRERKLTVAQVRRCRVMTSHLIVTKIPFAADEVHIGHYPICIQRPFIAP